MYSWQLVQLQLGVGAQGRGGGRHGLGAELVQLAGAQLGQLQLGVGAQGRGGGCHGVGAELAQLHLDGGMGGRWRRHRVLQS